MNNLNRLKDIYPLENINEPISSNYTAYILATILLLVTIILFVKTKKKRKKEIKKPQLTSIDFSNNITKEKLYNFTKIAKSLPKTKEQKEELEKILKAIEKYKYKKDIPKIDEKIIKQIQRYIKQCS